MSVVVDAPALAVPQAIVARADRSAYRADIDGLRALAVVPVVLFHSELGIVSGGFVGVDIFFVISGYLITRLLLAELDRGALSLTGFYERRIRRIFPALFVLLIACTLAAVVVLLPRDLSSYGANLAAAATSLSNAFLWFQADYFDGSAKLKPLLHTWSLSLEEQFYLFWPVLLIVLWKIPQRWRRPVVTTLGALSFAACIWATARWPSAAFYLLPYRTWELLLGGALAMGMIPRCPNRATAQVVAAGGLAMIGYAIFALSEVTAFPGAAAAIPCVGAAMIIHAGEQSRSTVVRRALSHPLATFVGQISYSLYLWHWPLFVFVRYRMIEEPPAQVLVVATLLALLCSIVSWRLVELPFRRKQVLRGRAALFRAAAAIMICTVAAGAALIAGNGLPWRYSAETVRLAAYADHTNSYAWSCSAELRLDRACVIGDPARLRYALIGDSHAAALRDAMRRIAESGPATLYGAASRCPPLLGRGTDSGCLEANRQKLALLAVHPELDTVVIAARWTYYYRGRALDAGPAETNSDLPRLFDDYGEAPPPLGAGAREALTAGITRMVDRLLAVGKTVVIVYPIPEIGHDVPFTLARLQAKHGDVDGYTMSIDAYRRREAETAAMLDRLGDHPRLRRVYPADILCRTGRCVTALNGVPLYSDSNHLSAAGARLLAPAIAHAAADR